MYDRVLFVHFLAGFVVEVIGILILVQKSPKFRGKLGEWDVSRILYSRCDERCITLDNVTLKIQEGDTTQIDHLVISPAGVFVIETKCYQGQIFGQWENKEWTQKIRSHIYSFQNPFRQNYKHVKAIEGIFPEHQAEHIHSMVVMTGGCEWGEESNTKPEMLFTSASEAAEYINKKVAINPGVIDVELVKKRIQEVRLKKGLKTDTEHVQNLRRNRKN